MPPVSDAALGGMGDVERWRPDRDEIVVRMTVHIAAARQTDAMGPSRGSWARFPDVVR